MDNKLRDAIKKAVRRSSEYGTASPGVRQAILDIEAAYDELNPADSTQQLQPGKRPPQEDPSMDQDDTQLRTEVISTITDLAHKLDTKNLTHLLLALQNFVVDLHGTDFEPMKKATVSHWPRHMRKVRHNSGPEFEKDMEGLFQAADEIQGWSREDTIKSIFDGSRYVVDSTKDPQWAEEVRVDHLIEEARGLATDALYDMVAEFQSERLRWMRIGQPQYILDEVILLLEKKAQLVGAGVSRNESLD